jgi:hypothetical protein
MLDMLGDGPLRRPAAKIEEKESEEKEQHK